ncbi:unnamed protein product [Caenorhabditis auriculariae]|uniref:ABC-2 type transporter transmembrane domain-containing protein n=1 Tax=Caenorhabditis auriculariae TaxID=2777116 RepID=A0A8S1HQJ7_9PELO|nr:unnamed protein product [Caenorhabditis auriculariae]
MMRERVWDRGVHFSRRGVHDGFFRRSSSTRRNCATPPSSTRLSLQWRNIRIAPSYSVAVTISGPVLTIFSMTGGIFTNTELMPAWIKWVQYLSWFRFGYEALVVNVWAHEDYDDLSCKNSENVLLQHCEPSGDHVIKFMKLPQSAVTAINQQLGWLVIINASLNFFIYFWRAPEYRKAFISILRCNSLGRQFDSNVSRASLARRRSRTVTNAH